MKSYCRFTCAEPGCCESVSFAADNRQDRIRLQKTYSGKWKCYRHKYPDEVLGLNNLETVVEMVNQKRSDINGQLFWDGRRGSVSGNGYKAISEDFPEGTRLIVTAKIILPEQEVPK